MKLYVKFLLPFLLLMPALLCAQVIDDFTDGNFTENPAWIGDVNQFIVNSNFQLQLQNTVEAASYLSTANSICNGAEWHFWVKLSFSPSANNFARFYLVSDKAEISGELNGYFIQLGEAGSEDAIELFRQNGSTLTSVCHGTAGLIAASFTVSIKVVRDDQGLWTILADPNGGDNYQLEAQGSDNTFTQTAFIGVYCKYTVSNSNKFYFDNIYAGPIIVDDEPPVALSATVVSDSVLSIIFSEPLDQSYAQNTANYLVNNGIGFPASARLADGSSSLVELEFDDQFILGNTYSIDISNIKDLAGNVMIPQEIQFSYYLPGTFDVVINEIMADPNPVVGLPDFEYLELFNRTGQLINLEGWILSIGSSDKLFGQVTINPGGFLILGDEEAESALKEYGPFYGFSSFTLTNSGQELILKEKEGNIVSAVNYSLTWYDNPEKEEGGWSLEQINPSNVCSGQQNWKASVSSSGGTPGVVNSVFSEVIFYPSVSRIEISGSNTINLYFDQVMDRTSLVDSSNYQVIPSIGYADVITWEDQPDLVSLVFSNQFENGTVYELTVSQNLLNCMGIAMLSDTIIPFGLTEIADSNDVVINEILFNPWTDGVDYVEIYNRSDKVIDLSQLKLGKVTISPPNPPDTLYYTISTEQLLMVPQVYFLLSPSSSTVQKQYYTSNPNGFIQADPFPAFNNDYGSCLLASSAGQMIDAFDYSEDMHYPLLIYVDGVAMERTNFDSPTNDNGNWHSAAQSVGFGTPAYQNSQFVPEGNSTDEISVFPEIFSPDNDGSDDILSIQYNFDQPGYMLSITVFNSKGQLMRQLVNNEYVGTSGNFNWNGFCDDNSLAAVGIYVFFIEIYDLNGNVKKFKKTGVLATKL